MSLVSFSLASLDLFLSAFQTYLAILISGLVLIVITYWNHNSNREKLPPGPPGWPVIGNLFQFARSGKQFFEYVEDLINIYGPILTLRLGSRTMIIISDASLAHEALIERGAQFATRPVETPTRKIFSSSEITVHSAMYGPVWRSLRRNMVQNMLSSNRLKEFGFARKSAMDKLIERIKSEARDNEGLVWVLRNSRLAAFCVLLDMCFGVEMEEESMEKMDEMMTAILHAVDPKIHDYLPILTPFNSGERNRALELRRQLVDFVVGFIEKRRKAIRDPASDKTASSFSYLDTLFDLRVGEGTETTPSDEDLVTLCSEFLNAGTDTTGAAIEWGIAELIANPDIQSRLYDEIKSTVGDRAVEEKDVDKMVFLQGVVKEILRRHPPTYFTLSHGVTEATTLSGYSIPVGVNVEFYLPGISEDPKIWSDPKKFDPNRFVSGREDADMTGVAGVKMMPFGAGRRICPGMGMATVHVNLMIARMVQEFEWSAYPPESDVDFAGKLVFAVVMKKPLRAIVKPRASN
uniref:Cytochrome P450 77A7 n=1 Tax=Isatis tinctoria TaxID=161756 RepID=A0A8F0FS09_ISATI|nr:cytochrome P450 77A7 [Isatis tinctoria]